MYYTTVLPNACPQDVLQGVQKLAEAAAREVQENEFRPHPFGLYVAEMDLNRRPIFVKNSSRRLFAIYNRLPCPGLPCGDRLLVVGIPNLPDCAEGCQGQCRSILPVEVRVDERFPLDFEETHWALDRIFGVEGATSLDTHPSWLSDEFLCECWELVEEAPRKAGAPINEENLKLEKAIELLKNIRDNQHLKPDWLAWYVERHGSQPIDIDGSFRHAAAGCVRRIEARRKEMGNENGSNTGSNTGSKAGK